MLLIGGMKGLKMTKVDKPWITEDCKNLYRQYKH